MQGRSRSSQGELQFQTSDGNLLPVYIALSPLHLSDVMALCMVVTDLTEQKQHQELQSNNRRKDGISGDARLTNYEISWLRS